MAITGNVALSDSVNTGRNQGSQQSANTLEEKGLVSEGHQDTWHSLGAGGPEGGHQPLLDTNTGRQESLRVLTDTMS